MITKTASVPKSTKGAPASAATWALRDAGINATVRTDFPKKDGYIIEAVNKCALNAAAKLLKEDGWEICG